MVCTPVSKPPSFYCYHFDQGSILSMQGRLKLWWSDSSVLVSQQYNIKLSLHVVTFCHYQKNARTKIFFKRLENCLNCTFIYTFVSIRKNRPTFIQSGNFLKTVTAVYRRHAFSPILYVNISIIIHSAQSSSGINIDSQTVCLEEQNKSEFVKYCVSEKNNSIENYQYFQKGKTQQYNISDITNTTFISRGVCQSHIK